MAARRLDSAAHVKDQGSEAKLRAILGLSPTILCVTGLADGRIREVNDTFLQTTGYSREEILGRTVTELGLWVDPDQRDQGMRSLRAGKPIPNVEARFRIKNGEERVTILAADVVMIEGVRCVLAALIDITDRKRTEEELRERREEAEALAESLRAADRAKDVFLAMLGHELRNPLGTITNAVAVLDTVAGNETTRNLVAVIDRQTRYLARIVDDLLDVARLTSGKIELRPETVDLHELAAQCLEVRAHTAGSRGRSVELRGESVRVDGDPARLAQVLDNLVDNALKYTPPGGSVVVATSLNGDQAVLCVRDSGNGMAPDLVPHVFDLFTQAPQTLERSHGGLGLGLALVKRLVELHGGSVSASSGGAGKGSEFTILLPLAAGGTQRPAAAPQTAAVRAGSKAAGRRVLVVEDSADARMGVQLLLEQSGHVVETAVDGLDGLAKLGQFHPDVALIDVGLPGMDGYELARAARSRPETRDIRLIAITGYGQAKDRQKAVDAGFDLHLAKPVDPAALRELLARL
jgi:PAS domain S-box-containing protein